MKGNGTLETERDNSMQMKLPTTSHPPVGASRNIYSSGTPSTPIPLATEKDLPHVSPMPLRPYWGWGCSAIPGTYAWGKREESKYWTGHSFTKNTAGCSVSQVVSIKTKLIGMWPVRWHRTPQCLEGLCTLLNALLSPFWNPQSLIKWGPAFPSCVGPH